MGQALYRKHRPKKLSEIIGQEHITTTLGNAIKHGKISHAYLLTGPRGTGKTSIARILAHEINQLPYTDETIHLDIIEIDAASNRRIDEIRELKDRVNIAPTSAKYKVYIIDEVHMLTREAFNALLKTLEEPPEHAVFILATTESHKLPETIISRTQRYSFRPVEQDKVVAELGRIAKQENLTIENEALALIAQHGGGSFRDSISMLDQVGGTGETVTASDVRQALGQAPQTLINDIQTALEAGSAAQMTALLSQALEQGVQPPQLAQQLSIGLRDTMIQSGTAAHVQLLRDLMNVPAARNPQIALELALYGSLIAAEQTVKRGVPDAPTQKNEEKPPARNIPKAAPTTPHTDKPDKTVASEPKESESKPQPQTTKPVKKVDMSDATDAPTAGDWKDILDAVRAKHNTLYGIARMATPQFSSGKITLVFGFPFHHKRVSDAKNHEILSTIAQQVTGQPLKLAYVLDKQAKSLPADIPAPEPKIDLTPITEIFGDAELLDE